MDPPVRPPKGSGDAPLPPHRPPKKQTRDDDTARPTSRLNITKHEADSREWDDREGAADAPGKGGGGGGAEEHPPVLPAKRSDADAGPSTDNVPPPRPQKHPVLTLHPSEWDSHEDTAPPLPPRKHSRAKVMAVEKSGEAEQRSGEEDEDSFSDEAHFAIMDAMKTEAMDLERKDDNELDDPPVPPPKRNPPLPRKLLLEQQRALSPRLPAKPTVASEAGGGSANVRQDMLEGAPHSELQPSLVRPVVVRSPKTAEAGASSAPRRPAKAGVTKAPALSGYDAADDDDEPKTRGSAPSLPKSVHRSAVSHSTKSIPTRPPPSGIRLRSSDDDVETADSPDVPVLPPKLPGITVRHSSKSQRTNSVSEDNYASSVPPALPNQTSMVNDYPSPKKDRHVSPSAEDTAERTEATSATERTEATSATERMRTIASSPQVADDRDPTAVQQTEQLSMSTAIAQPNDDLPETWDPWADLLDDDDQRLIVERAVAPNHDGEQVSTQPAQERPRRALKPSRSVPPRGRGQSSRGSVPPRGKVLTRGVSATGSKPSGSAPLRGSVRANDIASATPDVAPPRKLKPKIHTSSNSSNEVTPLGTTVPTSTKVATEVRKDGAAKSHSLVQSGAPLQTQRQVGVPLRKHHHDGWAANKSRHTVRDTDDIDYGDFSAYMEFLGTGLFATWRARWIVVHDSSEESFVRIYRFQEDRSPAHEWMLSDIFVEEFAHPQRKRGCTIHIAWRPKNAKSKRARAKHYYATCRSYDEMDAWLQVLRGTATPDCNPTVSSAVQALRPINKTMQTPPALVVQHHTAEMPDTNRSRESLLTDCATNADRWVVPTPCLNGPNGPRASGLNDDEDVSAFRAKYASQRTQAKETAEERKFLFSHTDFKTATLTATIVEYVVVDMAGKAVETDPEKAAAAAAARGKKAVKMPKDMHVNYIVRIRFVLGEHGVREGDMQSVFDQGWSIRRRFSQFHSTALKLASSVPEVRFRALSKPNSRSFHPDLLRSRKDELQNFLDDVLAQRSVIFDERDARFALQSFLAPVQIGDERPDGFLLPFDLDL